MNFTDFNLLLTINVAMTKTISNTTTVSGKDIYYSIFVFLDPVNIILGTFIVVLNSVLVVYYYHNSRTLTTKLFILIAIADVLFSIGHVVSAWAEVLYYSNWINLNTFWSMSLSYRAFGLSSYFCSIFFNVVMAVLRTIRIVSPFYQPSVSALMVLTSFYCALVNCLSFVDVYNFARAVVIVDDDNFWLKMVIPLFEFSFPGTSLFPVQSPWLGHINIFGGSLVLLFVLPVTIVLVCMLIQIYYVKYIERSTDHTPLIDWDHINTTVLLLSLLFFVCNCAAAFTWCIMLATIKEPVQVMHTSGILCFLVGFVISTLPLIYATLFPVIIVTRNSHMRKDMMTKLRKLFKCITEPLPIREPSQTMVQF